MEFSSYQLLIDFGLVVLILLVQLCIYPAFKYFEQENLNTWHQIYTPNITYVVLPLMLGQIAFSTYYAFMETSILHLLHLTMVILAWISTFAFFVPLHQKINTRKYNRKDLFQLEKGNWFRVVVWVLVFGISLLNFIISEKPIQL